MSEELKIVQVSTDEIIQVSKKQLDQLIQERDFYKSQIDRAKVVSNTLIKKFTDEAGELDFKKVTDLLVPIGKQLMMMKLTRSEKVKEEMIETLKAEIGLEQIQEIQKIIAANE